MVAKPSFCCLLFLWLLCSLWLISILFYWELRSVRPWISAEEVGPAGQPYHAAANMGRFLGLK